MTAPTKRLGARLRELDHQMVLAALDGERLARGGDAADAARYYVSAGALATDQRHVWEGIGGPDDPEAARYGGFQGHYALRANACADQLPQSAGPSAPPAGASDDQICDWCGAIFSGRAWGSAAGVFCSEDCMTAAWEDEADRAAGGGGLNTVPGDVAARDSP
jgi:hypothetical protein